MNVIKERFPYRYVEVGTLENGKPSFIMMRVDDGRSVKDVSVLKDSFKSNLETCLDFYEQVEEYEMCSKILNLIKQINE